MSSEKGAPTNETERKADATSQRSAALALMGRSLGGRRSLPVLSLLLGIGAVVVACIVVVSSFLQSREEAKARYLQNTKTEIRMLATAIDMGREDNWDQVRKTVLELWMQAGHWVQAPDEHFVIVDNASGDVILHLGEHASDNPSVSNQSVRPTIVAVRERLGFSSFLSTPLRYTGEFRSDTGEEMLGSFLGLPPKPKVRRNWLLGIYRSKAGLYAAETRLGLFGTSVEFSSTGSLVLASVLAMLLSLLLLFYTYFLTRRKQVQTEEDRARLAAIVQNSDDAIFSQSFDGHITSWNRGAERVFGYLENEAVNQESRMLIPSEREADERYIIMQIEQGELQGEHALEAIRVRKDGRPIHVSQTVSPLEDSAGRRVGVSIIARDISSRKNLERQVLESTGSEQRRIGRELHDSLGQELTGLSYLAKGLAQKLSAEESPQTEIALMMKDGVQRALTSVRSAVQGLVPVEVDATGFMAALEKLTADTSARCGIDCRVEEAELVQIDDNVVATHLFRIVQEAINNAVKHAKPSHIFVRPTLSNGTLTVAVEDDGVGIANSASRNGGMGLQIMQYRAGVIDGTVDVHARKGGGTAVICQVKHQSAKLDS